MDAQYVISDGVKRLIETEIKTKTEKKLCASIKIIPCCLIFLGVNDVFAFICIAKMYHPPTVFIRIEKYPLAYFPIHLNLSQQC